MKFKKRFLMVFCSIALLAGMLGGGSVSATEAKITFSDLVVMSDEDLAKVPQSTLKACLDYLAQSANNGGQDVADLDEKQIDRIYQQWLANCERATLDSIYDIPLPVTDQIDTLTIGTDTWIYGAEYGYYTTGGAQSLARYDVGYNQQEAVTSIVGFGSCYGSAYTGDTFYVQGGSTSLANVYVYGYLKAIAAMTPSFGYGSTEVKYEMVIEKMTGPANESRTQIHRINGYFQVCDNYFSANTNYYFEPDNWYRITMVVHSSASWIGLGDALADAFSPSEYARWFYVTIDWY